MRQNISASYVNFIYAANRAIIGHLYQFASLIGLNDYFTDLDFDVNFNGVVWKSGALRIDGLRRKTSVGLETDEQNVKIWAQPGDTLFGAEFLTGAETGLLDGCLITRYRIVWPIVTGNIAYDAQNNAPIGVYIVFRGYTSEVVKGGQSHVELKVKSPLVKLEVNMPRNYFQPGCLWNLFDVGYTPEPGDGCTLNQANFAFNSSVASTPSATILGTTTGVSPVTGADSIPYYAQGRLIFTSGVNNSLVTLINTNDATYIYLAYPLDVLPSVGDTFVIYPGCSKSFNTCNLKFNNSQNFRGFDKVPPIMVSI